MQAINYNFNIKLLAKFILPSLVGICTFLVPIEYNGKLTIVMAILADELKAQFSNYLMAFVLLVVAISCLLTLWYTLIRRSEKNVSFMEKLFSVSSAWLALRVLGCITCAMIYYQVGPSWIWSEFTGSIVLKELATSIIVIFVFAAILLPLLTDYGLMELVGALFQKPFKRFFCIPGRASVDATASWLSSAAVGVLITNQQYERGYYSAKDASIIATTFSIVSVPFTLIIAEFVGLGHVFVQFYITVTCTGLVLAMLMPRLPPLVNIASSYCSGVKSSSEMDKPDDVKTFRWGLEQALERAESAPSICSLFISALKNIADIWFGLMPPLIFIATLGLVIVEYTPIMIWLSYPFVPLLEILQIPEANLAAPAMLVGFAEMFLPAVVASNIESELTRFVVISVSVSQLIYMSEVGILILKSSIPINLLGLVKIFLLRTFISLPLISLIAHLFVFT